jgi:hypothetical protein
MLTDRMCASVPRISPCEYSFRSTDDRHWRFLQSRTFRWAFSYLRRQPKIHHSDSQR